ncbi:MAG: hypothetical protein JXR58_13885 [Bacteroidales bacterium]|nr:hypothetical protein [Bacteroidales bacterium]
MGFLKKIFGQSKPELEINPSNVQRFAIIPPSIPSGEVYFFTSASGVEYEVRFGKIKDTLARVVNFNVLNDEYADDEYAETNKGEIFKVVATVLDILILYMEQHPLVRSYEFNGEFKDDGHEKTTSIRTRFFCRALSRTFPGAKVWIEGNRGKIAFR